MNRRGHEGRLTVLQTCFVDPHTVGKMSGLWMPLGGRGGLSISPVSQCPAFSPSPASGPVLLLGMWWGGGEDLGSQGPLNLVSLEDGPIPPQCGSFSSLSET